MAHVFNLINDNICNIDYIIHIYSNIKNIETIIFYYSNDHY